MSQLRSSMSRLRTLSSREVCSNVQLSSTIRRGARSFGSGTSGRAGGGLRSGVVLSASIIAGLGAALVYSQSNSVAHCDGAPALSVVDSYGRPWKPVDALEQDDPKNVMRIRMALWVKALQDHIVTSLEAIESSHPPGPLEVSPSTTGPKKFFRDAWIRPEGGEGSSCVLSGGRVFEKAGVNISIVHGKLPTPAQKAMKSEHADIPISEKPIPFWATGLSIVIHPRNPHVPTIHLNIRYFELERDDGSDEPLAWWFGGGTDLTPSYLDTDDVKYFHKTLKSACDAHNTKYWPKFKDWCDKYFYIPHRQESRGVGGIFFDDLNTSSPLNGSAKPTQDELFDFVKTMSGAFLPAYLPIVLKNKDKAWTDEERRWQLLRRGRYVEFNLGYDRGTKFGLATPGARIESILMSLPETARWEYQSDMGKPGTKEGELIDVLKKPREWA
ncbi:Coproporphyrinogen III oxidase [Kockovaella imperatae]|uniref:coproporphyrinogen oxidase n=1 Tax=Kockovaella imperatae TaxID=4999 RepID=A0A1Y1UKD9_9TREE|nr:Coproporphyrinogen III oxidase [Kockovaella imperatae]ORX37974.1 Coproporphyrinogen III oxidase [Kockovaella imperatae]